MIRTGASVDELADDVCMAGVLGGLGDHPNEQHTQGCVVPVLRDATYLPDLIAVLEDSSHDEVVARTDGVARYLEFKNGYTPPSEEQWGQLWSLFAMEFGSFTPRAFKIADRIVASGLPTHWATCAISAVCGVNLTEQLEIDPSRSQYVPAWMAEHCPAHDHEQQFSSEAVTARGLAHSNRHAVDAGTVRVANEGVIR